MEKKKDYQVFIDLEKDGDFADDGSDMEMDSMIVLANSASEAKDEAWHRIERLGLYKDYRSVYVFDVTEDDVITH